MSPFIEIAVFFLICVLTWGIKGALICIGICAGYYMLLLLAGGALKSKKGPPE